MPTLNDETGKRLAASFGAEAARYDRTRPPYPDELVDRIVAASPGPRVVDVGCGTGTLSRQLQAAGFEVLGVEHDELMAEFARGTGVPVEVSKFEAWEPGGREYDAVVAGQSWHWVAPEAGPRKAAKGTSSRQCFGWVASAGKSRSWSISGARRLPLPTWRSGSRRCS